MLHKKTIDYLRFMMGVCLIFLVGFTLVSCSTNSADSQPASSNDSSDELTDLPPTPPTPPLDADQDDVVVVTADDESFGEII
jgi:hypothetical protein